MRFCQLYFLPARPEWQRREIIFFCSKSFLMKDRRYWQIIRFISIAGFFNYETKGEIEEEDEKLIGYRRRNIVTCEERTFDKFSFRSLASAIM